MTIYPARNKKGAFTGSWTVEVMLKGKRTRATAPDIEFAEKIERELKAGRPVPQKLVTPQAFRRQTTVAARVAEASTYTLARLLKDASLNYEYHKDAEQSRRRLATMVELLGPQRDIRTIQYTELQKAARTLAKRNKGPKTVNRYMSAISGALKWAHRSGHIEREPYKPWNPEKRVRKAVVPVTDDVRVYEWLRENRGNHQHVVYAVLVSTGLRISELLTLEPHEIEPEWLRLSDTKNGDPRDVPIKPSLSATLRDLVERGALPAYETVRKAFVDASEALSLSYRITPHVLRHTAGTRLNSAKIPTATIQAFLGHKDVRTTLGYIHADRSAVQEASKHLDGDDKPW